MGKKRQADYQGVMQNWHDNWHGTATAIWEMQSNEIAKRGMIDRLFNNAAITAIESKKWKSK